jgi:O-antigen/teichoic acid export membrane protein
VSIGDSDFGVQVGIGFLGRTATLIVAFLGSIFLARVLGPDGYGSYYFIAALAGLLDNPITGWARACKKRFTEVDFPKEQAVGSLMIVITLGFITMLVGSWLTAPILQRFSPLPSVWLLLAVLFLGTSAFRSLQEILNGTDRFGSTQWVTTGRDVLRVLLQAGLVTAGFGVVGMVWGMAVASLLLCPVILLLARVRPEVPTWESTKDIWQYGKSSVPAGLVGTAKSRADIILLGVLATNSAIGYYEIALRMTVPAVFLASVASGGLVGRISELESRGEEFYVDIENNLSYASFIAIPIFFGSLSIGGPVVGAIYGSKFIPAGEYIAGLALYRVFSSQKQVLASVINGLDRPDLNLYISTATAVINISLGLALLFIIGPLGVVIATVVTDALSYGVRFYVVHSLVPSCTLVTRPLIHQLVGGVLMGASVFLLWQYLSTMGWIAVILSVMLGVIIYFGILVTISTHFRETVAGILDDLGVHTPL